MAQRRRELEASGKFGTLEEDQIRRWVERQSVGRGSSEGELMLPEVRFENGEQRTVFPVCQDSELGDPKPFSACYK